MKKTEKSIERTKVTVINRDGESALVEYAQVGGVERKYIPVAELGDGYVLNDVLAMGIHYGYPWDEIEIKFDSLKFSAEMHKVGLWTADDALRYPQKVWSALNAVLGNQISNILSTALQEKKRGKQ